MLFTTQTFGWMWADVNTQPVYLICQPRLCIPAHIRLSCLSMSTFFTGTEFPFNKTPSASAVAQVMASDGWPTASWNSLTSLAFQFLLINTSWWSNSVSSLLSSCIHFSDFLDHACFMHHNRINIISSIFNRLGFKTHPLHTPSNLKSWFVNKTQSS